MNFNPYQQQLDEIAKQIKENESLLSDAELGPLAQEEIKRLQNLQKTLDQAAQDLANAQDDQPQAGQPPVNCIIEIRGGAGGDEAKLWAEDLKRMYLRFAEELKFKIEYIDDLVFKIKGKGAEFEIEDPESGQTQATNLTPYEIFKYESGVHRVQRVPVTESQGRIHTSTASVAVLPEVHPGSVEIRDEDLEWQFVRAGGAGGQSVNKTSSAVRLTHKPSGIAVSARQERKQAQNRQIALELLRAQLWEIEEEKRLAKIGDARSAIGRNMRAEKIRTYNYPQNRVTDHRIKESWHDLPNILEGGIQKMILGTKAGIEKID